MKIKINLILVQFLFLTSLIYGQDCPEPAFSYYRDCEYNTVFTANYVPGASYFWDYGDGNTSYSYSTDITGGRFYDNNGTYSVTLTQRCPNAAGFIYKTITLAVDVYDTEFSLNASALTVLVNTPVEFSFNVNNPLPTPTYYLNIAGTVIDPSTNPYTWTPTSAGTYQIIGRVRFMETPGCDFYDTLNITVVNCPQCTGSGISAPIDVCVGNPVTFSDLPTCTAGVGYQWDFGDGVTSTSPVHTYTTEGTYTAKLILWDATECAGSITDQSVIVDVVSCPDMGCDDCIGSFAPTPGDYIAGTWVKQDNASHLTTYNNAGLKISFVGSGIVYGPYMPDASSQIIDGWQRIETPEWTIPSGATQVIIELVNTWTSPVYFDDIRIQPLNSSMKSYVYDPETLRLSAELDENNYATFYEYDEDGALVRVKKETERGIVTIKETRNNNRRIQP